MNTYIVPATFPDLDTAKRDARSLADALRTAGVGAELVEAPELRSSDDAAQVDPGPTTRELRVRAATAEQAARAVRDVVDGQLPPGMVLFGEPTPA